MTWKYHDHRLQANPWQGEEATQATERTQSNAAPSFPYPSKLENAMPLLYAQNLNKYMYSGVIIKPSLILMTYAVLLSAVQDSCASSPCHHGTCRHTTSHSRYECICESGWTGQYCTQKKSKIYNLLLPRIFLTRIKSSLLSTKTCFWWDVSTILLNYAFYLEACIFSTKGQIIIYTFQKRLFFKAYNFVNSLLNVLLSTAVL